MKRVKFLRHQNFQIIWKNSWKMKFVLFCVQILPIVSTIGLIWASTIKVALCFPTAFTSGLYQIYIINLNERFNELKGDSDEQMAAMSTQIIKGGRVKEGKSQKETFTWTFGKGTIFLKGMKTTPVSTLQLFSLYKHKFLIELIHYCDLKAFWYNIARFSGLI